jgi:glycosidase
MRRAFDKWLQLGIDGFRLDAVKYVNPSFVRDLIESLTEKYPNTIWIGEYFDGGVFEQGISGRSAPHVVEWLKQFPQMTIFDFSFAEATREYFAGRMENIGTPYFLQTILDPHSLSNVLRSRRSELVNFIDSQDIPRMLSLRGTSRKSYAAALRLMFISPGVPQLFYGDEVGLAYPAGSDYWKYFSREDSAWSRLPMPWDLFGRPEARAMLNLTRSLVRLRTEFPLLRAGRFELMQALNVSQWFGGASYMAVKRSRPQVAGSDLVFFLYSAQDRDKLEFAVDLPDGTYQAWNSETVLNVAGGHLIWNRVVAQDSVILVVRAPRCLSTTP